VPSDSGPDDVSVEPLFGSLQFTVSEVLKAFLDLDSNKGPGPDAFPLAVDPQKLCFGFCIANLSAIYRGIAILSTVGKLFELLVNRHMYEDMRTRLC
jgi:hypothetical protein